MVAINLDEMSVSDLTKLIANAQAAILKRQEADKSEALAKIKAVAAEAGFSLDELVKSARPPRSSSPSAEKSDKRSTVEPKYAHPENSEVTWTGRGKAPKWVTEHEASGKNRDDLLIAKA